MKKRSLYFLLLFSFYSFSQNNNSLLWEISGNNLAKKSYLYGTMHVSKKVAFRLDDVFFRALEASESVALESNPTTWLDSSYETAMLGNNLSSYAFNSGFYDNLFPFNQPREQVIRNSIRFDNRIINGYLYRKTGMLDNFEEETYIDMFIFQAGKKHNKPIIALENLEESRHLTTKARAKDRKKKTDPWLLKIMAKEKPYAFTEGVYHDRNIELLDSIGAATNTQFYNTFTPKDTLLGQSVFKDKTNLFFKAIKNNDSIVLKGYRAIKFNNNNVNALIATIKNVKFPEDRTKIKTHLIYELGQLKNPAIFPFLKQLYKASYTEPEIQIAVLKTLMDNNSVKSYQSIIQLIETDLPLNRSVSSLFSTKKDSLILKKSLFPALLNYLTIPEYKQPIYNLLTQLLDSNIVKPKRYKKYVKQINNDAKTEVKRSLSKKNNFNYNKINDLENYVKLLFPFKKDKSTNVFFNKLLSTKNYEALTTYHVLLKKQQSILPKKLIEITENNIKAQGLLIKKLNKQDLLPNDFNKRVSQQ